MAAGDENNLRVQGLTIVKPSPSDDDIDEASSRAASLSRVDLITWLQNRGCIFIKNMSGEPIGVFTRTSPKRVLVSAELRIALMSVNGPEAAFKIVTDELRNPATSFVVVDPPKPDAARQSHKSERVPVFGETYLSVGRYIEDARDASDWRWDCLDLLVRPGDKIVIQGTAVQLPNLIMPGWNVGAGAPIIG